MAPTSSARLLLLVVVFVCALCPKSSPSAASPVDPNARPTLDLNEAPAEEREWAAEPAAAGSWLGRARRALQLPAYFDFDAFRATFKRRYSRSEFWFRKSVFLANCMRIFRARISFRLGVSGALEGVNKFADRSEADMRRMFMAGPPAEFRPEAQSEAEYLAAMRREHERRLQDQRNDYELKSEAPAAPGGGGGEPDTMTSIHESQVKREIELMLAQAGAHSYLREAISDELNGFQAETFSRFSVADECAPVELPRPGQLSSQGAHHLPDLNLGLAGSGEYEPPEFGRCEQLDWSKHECFHQIYEQSENCGKCYVLATTSLVEFYKCSEAPDGSIERRKFSKDFVLECGQKFAPTTILGCLGGSMLDTLRFISLAGIYNIRGWKQRQTSELERWRHAGRPLSALDARCPLNQYELPFGQWGEIRVQLNPKVVAANEWRHALRDGPVVVSVQMPDDGLLFYAGGVHSGANCEQSGKWHAMLLVGFGTSDSGVAFWRFRNSWGADWGDAGHFNLATSVSGACLAGGVRVFREPLDG